MLKIQRVVLMSLCLAILLTGCATPQQVPVDPALTRPPVIPEIPEDATWRQIAETHALTLEALIDCAERMRVIREMGK